MARHKLTDSKIKGLTRPGVYGDGGGLYLRVQSSGTRSWIFIWRRYGARREIGLGPYDGTSRHVSLAAARAKADEARNIVGTGGDPKTDLTERKAAIRVATFGKIADEYIETMKSKWRGDKTLERWERFAKSHAKSIRNVPVDKVTTDDVVRVLRPMWHSRPETATKVRESLKLVIDHAKARGLRYGDNPAQWKGHLDQILPTRQDLSRKHHAAMPYADVPGFITRLRGVDRVEAKALAFTILTAVRTNETREATWDEIDLDALLWVIPAKRMKMAREFRVPLSDPAVDILKEMKKQSINGLVFPGYTENRPLSNTVTRKVLRDAGGGDFTVHGFRSSFRDWASEETHFSREVAEASLAHVVGDATERAYRRGDALAKRRELMKAWANYCTTVKGDVIPMVRPSA